MKIRNPWLIRFGSFTATEFALHYMATLDIRGVFYDELTDPSHPGFDRPSFFVFWHEYILVPFYLRGHCHLTMLLSEHQDAEWLAKSARRMGFGVIRGSTSRGGVKAIRQMVRRDARTSFTSGSDGPRGPRRILAPGPVFLASRLGIPLVAVGIGYERPWRVRSWDRFAVPRPYSRARLVMSPFLPIPPDLDRDGLEHYRQVAQDWTNRMTEEAEQWAESGARHHRERVMRPEPAPLPRRRQRDCDGGADIAHPPLMAEVQASLVRTAAA